MQFSLHHLMRPPETSADKPPLLILLHGVGSNEYDLFSLAPYLDGRFMVLSARAPNPMAPNSHAWFEVQFTPQGFDINPQQAEASRERLIRFIGEALDFYGADPRSVYLMGFSQGAIVSLSAMLTRPELLAGVVAMSGRILPEVEAQMVGPERLDGFPVMVVHGTQDQVIPISYGRAANELLSGLPLNLTYREYPMGHEINNQSLQEILAWLGDRLDSSE